MTSFTHIYLKELVVKSFRNLKELSASFSPTHNLFVGPNGHGKTNCLEAIALACSLKPLQSLQNADLINFDATHANIMGSFAGAHKMNIAIDIFSKGKRAKINDHAVKNAAQLVRASPLVSFIPAELTMIHGSASLRRRALDQAAAALFIEHVTAMKSYEKLLAHRNRLLKDWPIDKATLATFTELLIKEAAQVIFYRLKTIEHLAPYFSEKMHAISGLFQQTEIKYLFNDNEIHNYTIADVTAALLEIKTSLEWQEHKRKITLFGPHLDDVVFTIDGANATKFASRGQSRAIVLSFKLAQMIAIFRIRGVAPIIILDDIVSELDAEKKHNLIDAINQLNTQVFFSTTDLATFGSFIERECVFHVNNGTLSEPHTAEHNFC